MTREEFRLAQLHHALTVASSVPDPSDPDVQEYLHNIVTADPAALDGAAGSQSPAATNPPPSPEKS